MARAIWTGTVGFGLVQIPVSLYAAEERDELDLKMLDRRDFSPIGYERINKKTGKPVAWDDIVKGYEKDDGEYVVLTDADFEQANVEATHRIDILDFVDFSAIDPRYIDRPYYLAPQKAGKKAYAVLRETLRRTGKAGVGKVVIRSRQHLAAVVAADNALLLILLRFSDELRNASDLDLPERNLHKLGITPKELGMAEQLVEGMVEEFKPEKYEDEYKRDLLKLINKKAKAGEINRIPEVAETKSHRPHTREDHRSRGALASSLKQGPRSANRTQRDDDERPRRLAKTRSAHKKTARGEHHKKSA